jgi:hypothetical protein
MSEDGEKREVRTWNLQIWPGFWGLVFVVCAATGNCTVCGLDHDYVREYTQCRK